MKPTFHHHRSTQAVTDDPTTVTVTCAFCSGTGRDPFDLLSPQSICQVCGGAGVKVLHRPTRTCPFCQGAGVFPHSRLTCTCCAGVGVVEVPPDAVPCPRCAGSGCACSDPNYPRPESQLPCAGCGGKGFVSGGK